MKVEPSLRVEGHDNIFAIGDITNLKVRYSFRHKPQGQIFIPSQTLRSDIHSVTNLKVRYSFRHCRHHEKKGSGCKA